MHTFCDAIAGRGGGMSSISRGVVSATGPRICPPPISRHCAGQPALRPRNLILRFLSDPSARCTRGIGPERTVPQPRELPGHRGQLAPRRSHRRPRIARVDPRKTLANQAQSRTFQSGPRVGAVGRRHARVVSDRGPRGVRAAKARATELGRKRRGEAEIVGCG